VPKARGDIEEKSPLSRKKRVFCAGNCPVMRDFSDSHHTLSQIETAAFGDLRQNTPLFRGENILCAAGLKRIYNLINDVFELFRQISVMARLSLKRDGVKIKIAVHFNLQCFNHPCRLFCAAAIPSTISARRAPMAAKPGMEWQSITMTRPNKDTASPIKSCSALW